MPAFAQVLARSPWRVRAVFDTLPGSATDAATYTFVRTDGAPTSVRTARAWAIDGNAVELALTEALLDGLVYTLTATGVTGAGTLSHQRPLPQVTGATLDDDPEAEVFGVDLDWLAPSLTAAGDLPEVRGLACMKHDLVAIARTQRGELIHRPDAGAGVPSHVNGPTPLDEIAAAVKREWLRDDRVRQANPRIFESTTGEITIRGDVKTLPLDESVPITSRG
jgi:hypothetical protein